MSSWEGDFIFLEVISIWTFELCPIASQLPVTLHFICILLDEGG